MKNKKKLLLLFLSVLVFLPALTVAGPFDYTPMEKIPGFETADTSNFYNYIGIVYQFGLWAVGISAMLMISIGGYMYMTSAGNTYDLRWQHRQYGQGPRNYHRCIGRLDSGHAFLFDFIRD